MKQTTLTRKSTKISFVVPCYNEADNIATFYASLTGAVKTLGYDYEIVYVNDGSKDTTLKLLQTLAKKDRHVRVVNLSRNFGKEIATSAGIHYAKGEAILLIDADGQHPVELIPEFVKKWEAGSKVVVGVRSANQKEGFIKKYGSKYFYYLFNRYSGVHIEPRSTDFRLIDRAIQTEFIKLTEHNRITRGLIDWLGFEFDSISFVANPRLAGEASYSFTKLTALALNSFVSLSLKPLYFGFYIGLFILPVSISILLFSVLEELIGDPMNLHIRGSAYLVMFILFIVGLLLISQGIMSLYLSHIHTETQNRPLYIVDTENSRL